MLSYADLSFRSIIISQVNTDPMRSEEAYLDVVGKASFFFFFTKDFYCAEILKIDIYIMCGRCSPAGYN